jgi:hypothetical protein
MKYLQRAALDIISKDDYDNRIDVFTPDEARQFVSDFFDDPECNYTFEEAVDYLFHDPIPANGLVFYALHPNGEGRGFVYNADSEYSHLNYVIEDALEHAYAK